MSPVNPCLTCGACCAFFRVSFYWLEAEPGTENPVPPELTEDLPPQRLCMKGTNQKHPRCAALVGQVGAGAVCTIYENRPSPCREFGVQFVDGCVRGDAAEILRCNHARAAWGLPPLAADDAPQPEPARVI